MAIADGGDLPLAVTIASASPGEVTLVEQTLDAQCLREAPVRPIGDKAYDSDRLDARLAAERDIELIAPNRSGRGKTQDGRRLCSNFLAFVQLGCIVILGRQFAR